MVASSTSFQFAKDMFPDAVNLLQLALEYFHFQPVTCTSKEIVVPVTLFSTKMLLRNLDLLPYQLAGFVIGLIGALLMAKSKRISKSWFWGMFFFACMNASSIFCHNWTNRLSPGWELARIADIIFTGASSLSLAFVALKNVPHIYHVITFLIIAFFGVLGDYNHKMIPFTAELIYIGMMIFAFFALAPRIFIMTKSRLAISIALSGVFVIFMGPLLDKTFCSFGLPMSTVHMVFLGSDLALLGLLLIALDMNKVDNHKSKID